MFTVKNFVVLALATTSMAAPTVLERRWNGHWHGGWGWGNNAPSSTASSDESVVTEYATVQPVAATPTMTYTYYATATAAAETPAAETPAAATPTPASSGSDSSTDGYMAIVDKWRSAGGLKALTQSSKLEGNALKTVQDSAGQMVHELNSGSMAQVLAPGNANNFESVYVGGWLCEVPSEPGLNGICSTMAQGWDHSDGETGHADILTSTSYSNIGCALFDGIWACDLS